MNKKGLRGKTEGEVFAVIHERQLSIYKILSMGALLYFLLSNHLHLEFWFCSYWVVIVLVGRKVRWRSTALSKDCRDLTIYLNAQGNYLAAQARHPGCGKPKFKCHYSGEGVSPELPPLCYQFIHLLQDILECSALYDTPEYSVGQRKQISIVQYGC